MSSPRLTPISEDSLGIMTKYEHDALCVRVAKACRALRGSGAPSGVLGVGAAYYLSTRTRHIPKYRTYKYTSYDLLAWALPAQAGPPPAF